MCRGGVPDEPSDPVRIDTAVDRSEEEDIDVKGWLQVSTQVFRNLSRSENVFLHVFGMFITATHVPS